LPRQQIKGLGIKTKKRKKKHLKCYLQTLKESAIAVVKGKGGHKSPACRMKDKIPKDEWAINKANSAEQLHVNAEQPPNATTPSTTTSSTETRGWSGAQIQYQFYLKLRMIFCWTTVQQLIYFVVPKW
jgi:hypothetical protein